MVTPSTYELKMATMNLSSSTETNIETDKYEAVKKAAGPNRRMSDCGVHQKNSGHKRRLSVCNARKCDGSTLE